MFKRVIKLLIIWLFFYGVNAFAHSGRLDGSGGHRVNEEGAYTGRFIVLENGRKHYENGTVTFKKGSYHFHVKPFTNGYKDGIYLPVEDKNIKDTETSGLKLSDSNVVGSKEGDVYYPPSCSSAKKLKEENVIIFNDKKEAEMNGYTPSKSCYKEDNR